MVLGSTRGVRILKSVDISVFVLTFPELPTLEDRPLAVDVRTRILFVEVGVFLASSCNFVPVGSHLNRGF